MLTSVAIYISKLCNSRRNNWIDLELSTKTPNDDVENMWNDQLPRFYIFDFRILEFSHENDPRKSELKDKT